jgi:uncharacterized membrane protein YhaH (DUF805 family)
MYFLATGFYFMASSETFERENPEFFHLSSRIGRLRYVLFYLGYGLTFAVTIGVAAALFGSAARVGILATLALGLIAAMVGFVPTWRRLHDLDRTGWWALLHIVPFINILLFLYVCFMPGSKDVNSYGPPPTENSLIGKVLGGLLLIISVASPLLGIFGATNDTFRDYIDAQDQDGLSYTEELRIKREAAESATADTQNISQETIEALPTGESISTPYTPVDQSIEDRINVLQDKLKAQQSGG